MKLLSNQVAQRSSEGGWAWMIEDGGASFEIYMTPVEKEITGEELVFENGDWQAYEITKEAAVELFNKHRLVAL